MAQAYSLGNRPQKATEYLFKAKETAEKSQNHELIAKAYGSIANQYSYLDLHSPAKVYLDKALSEIDKLPESKTKYMLKGLAYNELGNINIKAQDFKSANINYRKSLTQFIAKASGTDHLETHLCRSYYNIGNSYLNLRQIDSAQKYLGKAAKIRNTIEPAIKFHISSALAQVYYAKNDFKRAITILKSVLNNNTFNDKRLKSEIFLALSRNYKALGQQEGYAIFNERYLQLNDELQKDKSDAIDTAVKKELIPNPRPALSPWYYFEIGAGIGCLAILVFVTLYFTYRKIKNASVVNTKTTNKKGLGEQKQEDNREIESTPSNIEKEILQKLQKFEEEQRFRNQRLNISILAVQLKTNTTYLSEVINKHKGKNFNTYLNELRISYICGKIQNDSAYLNYKISFLAQECGFNSHSTFATVFKNIVGVSPSVFISEAKSNFENKVMV